MDLETQSQTERGGSNSKCKAEEEPREKEVTMQIVDQANMEINSHKDNLSLEEQVMKWLFSEGDTLMRDSFHRIKNNYIKRLFNNIKPRRV